MNLLEADNDPQGRQHINEAEARNYEKDDDSGEIEFTRAEAALEAAQCGEYELAFRLCIVEDDLELLRRATTIIKTPCIATLSGAVRNALCTAFLLLLEGDEEDESSDGWMVLQWLQQWAVDIRRDRRQFEQLDPRVAQGLHTKLSEMAVASTKSALVAAHVLFLLGI
ncbi:hypothetical protein PRIC1_007344 [Phytophthora ramorum]|uniref:uncharacterized protein n=1 Tax=Phytophthora ramorum TaxID=164328 RepID=UPI0030A75AA1|nr:hypothetical protein KRP23_2489 [Phytophthora ramorum]KAH7502185.1 hypothetical protein KRP22_7656 [Phytophthora ramorum]